MANTIKWIRLDIGVFDDEKFDAIKTLPDKNDIQLIWVKLLCLAGRCDESGFLALSKEIPYTDEMLAERFDMDIGTVQRALQIFQSLKMIDVVDNVYMVSNWLKYQKNDELNRYKEGNRIRQQRHRDKQKQMFLEEKQKEEDARNVTRNVINNVNCCICECIEDNNLNNSNNPIDNNKNINSKNTKDKYKESIEHIIDYLNKSTGKRFKANSKSTNSHIIARLKEGFTEEDFKTVIDNKCAEWKDDPKMDQFLRPQTLFSGKFESYLNQHKPKSQNPYAAIDAWGND